MPTGGGKTTVPREPGAGAPDVLLAAAAAVASIVTPLTPPRYTAYSARVQTQSHIHAHAYSVKSRHFSWGLIFFFFFCRPYILVFYIPSLLIILLFITLLKKYVVNFTSTFNMIYNLYWYHNYLEQNCFLQKFMVFFYFTVYDFFSAYKSIFSPTNSCDTYSLPSILILIQYSDMCCFIRFHNLITIRFIASNK